MAAPADPATLDVDRPPAPAQRRTTMRALGYLLGARALDLAQRQSPRRSHRDPDLPPIAGTPAQARAWRAWAEAGRLDAEVSGGRTREGRSAPALGRVTSRPGRAPAGGAV
jgi:hypothetical protein